MLKRFRDAKADVATMRRLFPAAERIARAGGRGEPAADDLLLAALDLPDGTARAALADCGVEPPALRAALQEVRARPAPALPDEPTGPYPAEPSMRMTFHHAVAAAKARRSPVRSGDLLLAAIDPADGVVARALAVLSVDPDVLSAATRRRLGG